ncbi:TolC family protein [Paenibacillus phocaensis]|uniref:TolC family protein n=1 Tax=Paenibacillus phocaensis TaxID=1776378 RepID=UPI000839BB7D|nr:TolC family protein [Paenibacillus phocaensis]
MGKQAAGLVLSLILLIGAPISAFAASDDNTTGSGQHARTGENLKSSFVDSGSLLPLKHLDLDTVLKRAVDNSYNLSLLQMKLTALSQNKDNLKKQQEDLGGATIVIGSGSLPSTPEEVLETYNIPGGATQPELWMYSAAATNEAVNQVLNGVGAIAAALNKQIASQREQLELALEQLNTEQSNTLLDLEKAKTGAKLQITSQYVQLLSLNKQVVLAEKYLDILKADHNRAVTLKKQAMGTAEAVILAQRQVREQEEQLDTLKDNYQLALIQLCFDLGLVYDPEITLEDIAYTPEPITRKDTEGLLQNSYDMKQQWNAVVQANKQESHTTPANEHEEDYLDTMTRIADQQAEQTRVELSKKISKTYSGADTAYKAYQSATQDLADAEEDYTNMEARYKNGFVSRYDFNKYSFTLTQQQLALDLTRLQTFMANEAVKAMEQGLIN